MAEYLVGNDAIDVVRMVTACGRDIQLHRGETRIDSQPDTGWQVADALIASGQATPDEFFLDLTRLTVEESADVILSLIGVFKAWPGPCMNPAT